jgi:D-alanyl-D-alanine carboxypeptidase
MSLIRKKYCSFLISYYQSVKQLPFLAFILIAAQASIAQAGLPESQRVQIDKDVSTVLTNTGAPSASIAIVSDGKIVYEHAYGLAQVEPDTPATSSMRYSIGSVSKQFTAAAVLLLAEEKQLSLDDRVNKWLPQLTQANEVTIRQLLSMTAGYQDYWPQDYVFPSMTKPIKPQDLLAQWAQKPLDFEPGTKWQYSSTNYIIAGLIVEKVSKMPLFAFLQKRIFQPLGMISPHDADVAPLGVGDAARYLRNALGPLRPAPKEAAGWLFAGGQLAMTAHDLALWDIAVIDQKILRPDSYRIMQTDTLLKNGVATGYGLGVHLTTSLGHRLISHGGAVSGYRTANYIYPDEHAAIVVCVNIYPGAADPSSQIARRIAQTIFQKSELEKAQALERARRIFSDLQQGKINRADFSYNGNAYFSEQVVADFASSLGPLGSPAEFTFDDQSLRGGMMTRSYNIRFGTKQLKLAMLILADEKIEQFIVEQAQ